MAVDRLSLSGLEDGLLGVRAKRKVGAQAGLLLAGSGQELTSLTARPWFSCCSYLWIVPISSVRNGAEQKKYWLEGVQQSNAALSSWIVAPTQHAQLLARVLGITAGSERASFIISFTKWSQLLWF